MVVGSKRLLRGSSTKAGEYMRAFAELTPTLQDNANDSSMISYPNYKFIFPIKALGMFAKRFGDPKVQ